MLVWATEFPVAAPSDCRDVLQVATDTLATSRYSPWQAHSFGPSPTNELKRLEMDGHVVTVGHAEYDSGRIAGLQHQWVESSKREWINEIVGYDNYGGTVVSVRLHCNLLRPGLQLPVPKKPFVVGQLLKDLGGGDDSWLVVQDHPHRLAESGVDDAASLVNGTSLVRLPVVYVSAGRFRQPFVDADELAAWLGGMAHVVVEPSRYFSFALARNTGRANAYGGAVSIYWPQGAAAQVRYLPALLPDSAEMQRVVAVRVRQALTQIRPASPCTFQYLQELSSRAQVARLRAEGSTAVQDYVAAFDGEIAAKDERLVVMERELQRLRAEIYRYEQSGELGDSTVTMSHGEEREFYVGERRDAIMAALDRGRKYLTQNGRRAHLVEDVLRANEATDVGPDLEASLKDTFAKSGDLGQSQRRTLEDLGFIIEKTGKHWKVMYHGDGRYIFTVGNTGSDHRAGKNLASTIIKKLLK